MRLDLPYQDQLIVLLASITKRTNKKWRCQDQEPIQLLSVLMKKAITFCRNTKIVALEISVKSGDVAKLLLTKFQDQGHMILPMWISPLKEDTWIRKWATAWLENSQLQPEDRLLKTIKTPVLVTTNYQANLDIIFRRKHLRSKAKIENHFKQNLKKLERHNKHKMEFDYF
jgi:hypothetical protein